MIPMQTSEVLNRAADIIEQDGWHRNGYAPDPTENGTPMTGLPVCTMGAIYRAIEVPVVWNADLGCWYGFGDLSDLEAAYAVADYLDIGHGDFGGIPAWNDAKGRTAEEVIEVLRAAAVLEAAKENSDTREPVTA